MSFRIEDAREAVMVLDGKLRPIAKRPVDVSDPHWVDKLRDAPHPLDEAAVRAEAESLMASLLTAYSEGAPLERQLIRDILRTNASFAWATGVPEPPITPQGFRQHLLLLSANDGGPDSRDVILSLDDLLAAAKRGGIDITPIIAEVDALSSDAFQRLLGARFKTPLAAGETHEF